jgi:hypothetical protein
VSAGITPHDGACSQNKLVFGLNSDLSSSVPAIMSFRPVPSLSIMIGEPHRLQKRRFIGSPLCPPGIIKVVIGPVTTTLSAGNAMPETKAVPLCFWQSTQCRETGGRESVHHRWSI